MFNSEEIASITVLVPYHRGNETTHQITPFKLYRQQQLFKAIPLISAEERKLTGLSAELSFRLAENKVISEGDTNEANLGAINRIASELMILRIL